MGSGAQAVKRGWPAAAQAALLFLAACQAPPVTHAYFQSWGGGARGRGMAEAVTARRGFLEALAYNPAGLATLTHPSWLASYGGLAIGLGDGSALREHFLAAYWPLDARSGFGGGWMRRGLEHLLNEDLFTLAWQQTFVPPPDAGPGTLLSYGAAVKVWRLEQLPTYYTDNSTAYARLLATAVSMDAGVHVLLAPDVILGFAVQDPFKPSVSLLADGMALPTTYRIGVGMTPWPEWLVASDVLLRDQVTSWMSGVEWRSIEGEARHARSEPAYAVRAGVVASSAYGRPLQVAEWTAGGQMGWSGGFGRLTLDYAYRQFLAGVGDPWGTHRLALSMDLPASVQGFALPEIIPSSIELFPPLFLIQDRLPFLASSYETLRAESAAHPRDLVMGHRAAVTAAVAGLTLEAAAHYRDLAAWDPAWSVLAYGLMGELRYNPTPAAMVKWYQEACRADDAAPEMWWGLALWAGSQSATYETALEAFTRPGATTGVEGEALAYNAALAALLAGRLDQAEEALKPVLETSGDQWWVHEAQGRLWLARRRPDLAVSAFRKASELAGRTPRTTYHIGVALYAQQRFDEAVTVTKALADEVAGRPEERPIRVGLASMKQEGLQVLLATVRQAEAERRWPMAIDAYRKIAIVDPEYPRIAELLQATTERLGRAQAERREAADQYETAGQLKEALMAWRDVLAADPRDEEARKNIKRLVTPLIAQAQRHRDEKRIKDAFVIYDFVEQVDPGNEDAASGRASVRVNFSKEAESFLQEDKFALAELSWQAWLEIKPDDGEANRAIQAIRERRDARSAVLFQEAQAAYGAAEKDLVKAAERARAALAMNPEFEAPRAFLTRINQELKSAIAAAYQKGVEAQERREYAAARAAFQRVARLNPEREAEMKSRIEHLGREEGGRTQRLITEATQCEARLEVDQAVAKLQELLQAAPGHAEGKALLAKIQERVATAAASRERVQQLQLEADVLYGQGQIRSAIGKWEEAVQLDYYNARLRQKIEDSKKELR